MGAAPARATVASSAAPGASEASAAATSVASAATTAVASAATTAVAAASEGWLGAALVHASNAFALASMAQYDVLALRALMIPASACTLAHAVTRPEGPRLSAALWAAVFVLGHGAQVALLLDERKEVPLAPHEEDMFERGGFRSAGMRPKTFQRLLQAGASWEVVAPHQELVKCGAPVTHVYYIVAGDAHVRKGTEIVGEVHEGSLVGEMHFHRNVQTSGVWNSSIVAGNSELHVVSWPDGEIARALEEDEALSAACKHVTTLDLWRKMRGRSSAVDVAVYTEALRLALADGSIGPVERRALATLRRERHVSWAEHTDVLQDLGWTPESYACGQRSSNSRWLSWIRRCWVRRLVFGRRVGGPGAGDGEAA